MKRWSLYNTIIFYQLSLHPDGTLRTAKKSFISRSVVTLDPSIDYKRKHLQRFIQEIGSLSLHLWKILFEAIFFAEELYLKPIAPLPLKFGQLSYHSFWNGSLYIWILDFIRIEGSPILRYFFPQESLYNFSQLLFFCIIRGLPIESSECYLWISNLLICDFCLFSSRFIIQIYYSTTMRVIVWF